MNFYIDEESLDYLRNRHPTRLQTYYREYAIICYYKFVLRIESKWNNARLLVLKEAILRLEEKEKLKT